MARQKGIVRLQGSLGDLSFYSSVFGDIVRRKGGASKEKIRKSPAFKNLRKHQAEFSACAAAGKLLRQHWYPYTRQSADHTLVWRMTKVLNQVKDQDTSSVWGERSVQRGLEKEAGRTLVRGFDLNSAYPLSEVLKVPVIVKSQQFYLKGFYPKQDLVFPVGATAVCLRALVSKVDFEKKTHDLYTQEVVVDRKTKKGDLSFGPPLTTAKGTFIYLLQLNFRQLVNGQYYPLKEGSALGIVEVVVG